MAISQRKQETDFDPQDFLASHGQHEKDIFDLTGRISKIEGHLATPQSLALFLKDFAKDSRNLEAVFAEMFCRFMKENQQVQDAVLKKVEEVDRNFFFRNFKRLWLPVYSTLLIVGTIFVSKLSEWLVTLLPHVK